METRISVVSCTMIVIRSFEHTSIFDQPHPSTQLKYHVRRLHQSSTIGAIALNPVCLFTSVCIMCATCHPTTSIRRSLHYDPPTGKSYCLTLYCFISDHLFVATLLRPSIGITPLILEYILATGTPTHPLSTGVAPTFFPTRNCKYPLYIPANANNVCSYYSTHVRGHTIKSRHAYASYQYIPSIVTASLLYKTPTHPQVPGLHIQSRMLVPGESSSLS